ncbi:MAG: hypothetical protein QM765_39075 [Myxococcales bacterium]
MTTTATATVTTTMTEARVRAVMQKVSANLGAFVVAGKVSKEAAQSWAADLIYLQLNGALDFFEIQITPPRGERFGLRYTVKADGSIQQDSPSGGLDVYGLPKDARINLFAHFNDSSPSLYAKSFGAEGGVSMARSSKQLFQINGHSRRMAMASFVRSLGYGRERDHSS